MTTKSGSTADAQRRRELAAIHMAKRAIFGENDAAYRDALEEMTGARSAGDLTARQRGHVLDLFREGGWQRKAGAPSRTDSVRTAPEEAAARTGLELSGDDRPAVRKIKHLWLDLYLVAATEDASLVALGRWLRRMGLPAHVDWLTARDAARATEALKRWLSRL